MADPAPRGEESASLRKTGAADTEAAAARRRRTGREEGEDMAEEEALLGFLMASFSFFSSVRPVLLPVLTSPPTNCLEDREGVFFVWRRRSKDDEMRGAMLPNKEKNI